MLKAPDQPSAVPISRVRRTTTSFVLITFTFLVALLCVLLLSCTLTQSRIASIAVNGVNISIWKLDYIRVQWNDVRQQLSAQQCKLAQAQDRQRAASENSADFNLEYKPKRTLFDAKMEAVIDRVSDVNAALAIKLKSQGPVERLETIGTAEKALVGNAPELQPVLDDILKAGNDYRPLDTRRMKMRGDLEAANGEVVALTDNVNATKAALDGIFATQIGVKQLDDATRERVENAMYELYSGGKYSTDCRDGLTAKRNMPKAVDLPTLQAVTNYILLMSPDVLTLTLVIAMGVLGSALQMTHALFKFDEVDRVGAYFLRLCVGAITALIIFIVSKAGIPLVADTSRMAEETPINPYLVSFLAIISGLMSENAIMSVQNRATKLFGANTPSEPERWARTDLHKAFELAKRNPESVRQLLAASPDEFNGWISGTSALPVEAQTLIAGVLGLSRRDLFTDFPPGSGKGE